MNGNRRFVGPRHAWRTDLVREVLLQATARGPFLDLGCGDGDLTMSLAGAGHLVIAVDADLARISRARFEDQRDAARPASWLCADATRLPLRDACVTGVVMGEVLEHIDDDTMAVDEAARALPEGGHLVVTVPAGPDRLGDVDLMTGHVRRYDRGGLERLLVRNGFRLVLLRGWGFPFGRLYDKFVQHPAHRLRRSSSRRLAATLGRCRWMNVLWKVLFAIDELIDAGDRGSGWLVVAKKKNGAGELDPVAGHTRDS